MIKDIFNISKDPYSSKISGFTLAEVLITLSILGIIAAVAIPNVIQQYQKRVTITKLQKAYATLEKAATNIAVNSGCIGQDLNCTGLFDITNSTDFKDKFVELSDIKVLKNENSAYIPVKTLNYNKSSKTSAIMAPFIITKDNIAYGISKRDTRAYDENAQYKIGSQKVIAITVITNPKKMYKNNGNIINEAEYLSDLTIGREIFYFFIHDNFEVSPVLIGSSTGDWVITALDKVGYTSHTNIDSFCNPEDASLNAMEGWVCALKIIRDGWKINY